MGVRVLAALEAVALGADARALGALAATTAAPALLGALLAGRASDRWGGPVVAAAGTVVLPAGAAVVLTAGSLTTLFTGAATTGAGSLLAVVGQQATVAARSSADERTGRFASMTTAASSGQLLAPVLVTGGLAPASSAGGGSAAAGAAACLLVGCLALVAALGGVRSAARPTRSEQPVLPASALLRAPQVWRSLTTSAAVLVTVDVLCTLLPLWAAERGVGAGVLGLLLSVRAAVSVASRIALRQVVERVGARTVLVAATTAGAAAVLLLAWAPPGRPGPLWWLSASRSASHNP